MYFSTSIENLLPFGDEKKWVWQASCGRPGGLKLAFLNVSGIVNVPNPGASPRLVIASPQGINPSILELNLVSDQQPGIWSQVITAKPVGFTLALADCNRYEQIHIKEVTATIDILKY